MKTPLSSANISEHIFRFFRNSSLSGQIDKNTPTQNASPRSNSSGIKGSPSYATKFEQKKRMSVMASM